MTENANKDLAIIQKQEIWDNPQATQDLGDKIKIADPYISSHNSASRLTTDKPKKFKDYFTVEETTK